MNNLINPEGYGEAGVFPQHETKLSAKCTDILYLQVFSKNSTINVIIFCVEASERAAFGGWMLYF